MSKAYIYNFRVNGEYEDEIKTWLQSQSKKNESLKLAVMRAIHQYGATTDINQLKNKAFIENNNVYTEPHMNTNPEPTPKPQTMDDTPKKKHVVESTPVSQPAKPPVNTQTENKPDFGFLSKN